MQKSCRQCHASFEIGPEDLSFYDKVSPIIAGKKFAVPPPTFCPDCRAQRRYAFRNERKLYRRECAKTGKPVISIYHPDAPHALYSTEAWWSDDWDPRSFARDIDWSRPFFDQFVELYRAVPHIALVNVQNENCDYVNQCGWSKNCYMAFVTDFSEDCFYTDYCYGSKNCVDSTGLHDSELCYGCIDCVKGYHLRFCQNCSTCTDCSFCADCKGCSNCVGCTGLRNKEYHWYNEPLSKDEWEKRVRAVAWTPDAIRDFEAQAERIRLTKPHRHAVMVNCTDCTGNYLSNSKNARWCFDGKDMEDSKFCAISPMKSRDCYDMIGGGGELLYEVFSTGPGVHNLFCMHCWNGVSDLLYCAFCMTGSQECFGCMGLRKQRYCMLNKQYSKEEYEGLLPRLIEHMKKTSEWGEFFPASMSPFGYNETIAQDHYPLTAASARESGFSWRELTDEVPKADRVIPADKLPTMFGDVPDDILNWAIICAATGRPFKIIKRELDFYRREGLPVPRLHPDERSRLRGTKRNPRRLWKRQCTKCGKEIETSYAPERPERIYCEECYLKEVY